jgi:predicted transcriptional regulator
MESLFSTSQRIKILEAVIFRTDSVSVNNIASQLGLSKGLISKYFQILLKEQILKKEKGKLVVVDNASVKAVKILLNVRKIDTRIFGKYPFVTAVGLYGSCARGENTEQLSNRKLRMEKSSIAVYCSLDLFSPLLIQNYLIKLQ